MCSTVFTRCSTYSLPGDQIPPLCGKYVGTKTTTTTGDTLETFISGSLLHSAATESFSDEDNTQNKVLKTTSRHVNVCYCGGRKWLSLKYSAINNQLEMREHLHVCRVKRGRRDNFILLLSRISLTARGSCTSWVFSPTKHRLEFLLIITATGFATTQLIFRHKIF